MYRPLSRTLIGAGLSLALISGTAVAGSFTTIDDAQSGFLSGMSRNGHIVTGSYVGGGMYAGSWIWHQGAGYKSLPLTAAANMNSWGQPTVGETDDGSGNQVAAMVYSDVDSNGPVLIGAYPGSLPIDNFYSQAYGVSDDGVVVGLANDANFNAIAFRWTPQTGMTRMPVNRPDTYSRANGISGNGDLVYGWNDQETGYRQGVIWVDGWPVEPHNYGMYGDAFGSPPGEPLASNYDGSVVVGQGYFDDQLASEAWRWTQATDAQPIGVLVPPAPPQFAVGIMKQYLAPSGKFANAHLPIPSGFFEQIASYALAVSEDGTTIVGNTGIAPYQVDAFIWTKATGMVFLSDYAAKHGVVIPPGFLLDSANTISADGLTIGGNGVDPTGTLFLPWIIDMHDSQPRDTVVTVVGSISSNDLTSGPFVGFPVGSNMTMTFHLAPGGTPVLAGYARDYSVKQATFQLTATYLDQTDYSHPTATETLSPSATPLLHLSNDHPRADGLDLDATSTATSGQTLHFDVSNLAGTLFDSDQAARVNRSMRSDLFDTTTWSVTQSGHAMNLSLQWVTLQDDTDAIFRSGFEAN